jgi:hypothetical protein
MTTSRKRSFIKPIAVAALALSLAAGGYGVATAATITSPTSTKVTADSSDQATTQTTGTATTPAQPAGATAQNPWGNQRSDETLLTGDALARVNAVALAQVGSDATIVRVETDSDASLSGHAAYEAHVVKADGTAATVYVDKSFNFVSVETQPACGPGGGHAGASTTPAADSATSTTSSN